MMSKLILASQSPRRQELLRQVGIEFEVMASEVEEKINQVLVPEELVQELAKEKGLAVANKVADALIISADTIVVIDGEILGKPKDENEAFEMLQKLKGKVHQVITGVCLIDTKKRKIKTDVETTNVFMKDISMAQIKKYIATGEPFDKAGGYAIQGRAALFINKIEGCYSNVVGLPLSRVGEMFKEFGYWLW